MLFSSLTFLWLFLPIVLIGTSLLYRTAPKEKQIIWVNRFLLICSLFFYTWGGIYYTLIMISSILINYLGGFFVNPKTIGPIARKRNLIIIIFLNLTVLFVFKYFNMTVVIIEQIMEHGIGGLFIAMMDMKGTGKLNAIEIALPIGISFFTFQSMSYVIDVYTQKAKLQKSIWNFALYVSFFPQLIAGPIVKYSDIDLQLKNRRRRSSMVYEGQRRFIYGLAKKVLLANTFGAVADPIWKLDTSSIGGPIAWLGIICYTLQIYYDFSGYSDMAIGIGKMLGFEFKENFNHPYTALSIQDFWRRWHISLSSWFKEYVYIPLGGSRNGLKRTCRNTAIVFLLTGIWHGANFTFLFWGLFYAFLLILERLYLGQILQNNRWKLINWLYTMFMVMLAWIFFRSDNISTGFIYVSQLFSGASEKYSVLSYLSMELFLTLGAGILLSGFLQKLLAKKIASHRETPGMIYAEFFFQALLLFLCALKLISGSYNAFIYFQF